MSGQRWPLEHYAIVDLSTGVPGAYCTKLAADGGADVVMVEDPSGDPLRSFSASGAVIAADDDSAVFQYLSSSKRSVVVDPSSADCLAALDRLLATADGVVWSPGSPVAAVASLQPAELMRRFPHLTVLSITPFGLEGPWRDLPANDCTLQGWAGSPNWRGDPSGPPLLAGGRLAEWQGGMFAGLALLASLYRNSENGAGDLVDFSLLEANMLSAGPMYPVTYHTIAGKPRRDGRQIYVPEIHKTADGWVGFMVVTGQQWLDFCVIVGREDWREDESLIRLRERDVRRAELGPVIDAALGGMTTAEVLDLADALRVPAAPVGRPDIVTTFEHFAARALFTTNPRGGFTQPDVPYTLSSGVGRRPFEPAPRLGEHTASIRDEERRPRQARRGPAKEMIFDGLRVADFTAFWAGPIIGEFLAQFGADVIHMESLGRYDSMRTNSAKDPGEDLWWEWSPLFQGTNANKRGVTLDLQTEVGLALAKRLIQQCDVVVDNYTPNVMEGFGLGYEGLRGLREDLIVVRAPAYGIIGPWRHRRGYAQTIEQVSGMAWLTGYPEGSPQVPGGPCDPIGGAHATIALLLALEHRRRTGEGQLVEVPMIGGALNISGEQVVEYSAYGNLMGRIGNRSVSAAPQGHYRCVDLDAQGKPDVWVGISVDTDEQWRALVTVLGKAAWTDDPALERVDGRRAAHDLLDDRLAEWCACRPVDVIVTALQAAGVPVAKIIPLHEQHLVPPVLARRAFRRAPHPLWGESLMQQYPATFSQGPDSHYRSPAPMLGQHNREVLSEYLGLTDSELDALEAAGHIGTDPTVERLPF